jgi:YHS domain-containing protein
VSSPLESSRPTLLATSPRPRSGAALVFALAALVPAVAATSCASDRTSSAPPAASCACHATCPVCAWRGDLACVDVEVDAATPRVDHCGCTYCFCSEECRERFLKDPDKYLTH